MMNKKDQVHNLNKKIEADDQNKRTDQLQG